MTASAAKLPNLGASLTFARRKFYAWWEGYAFDEAAERAVLQAHFSESALVGRSAEELIGETIWGAGRTEPGSPAWTMHFARTLGLPLRSNVMVFGAGAGAPLTDLQHGTRWKVSGLTRIQGVSGRRLRTYDLANRRTDKPAAGGISFFEFHQDSSPAAFAGMASSFLAPGAKAVFVDYVVVRRNARMRACFPSPKLHPPKTEAEYQSILANGGFAVEAVTDETMNFMPLVSEGWAGWRRAYGALANVEDARVRANLLRAMAKHAHMWAERFEAMKSGQLRVVSFRATRK